MFGGYLGHSEALAMFAAAVAVVFAAKGIIQSPVTSCSRKDHSVCRASANSIWKISGYRRCGLLAENRVVALHSAGEV